MYVLDYYVVKGVDRMDRLKKLRLLNGLTQDALAERLNVARTTVTMWETGEAKPRVDTLIQLARIFDCSLDELLETERG